MRSAPNHLLNSRGFSLIELSIWLTILGVIMAASLTWLQPATLDEATRLRITMRNIHHAERALEAFRVYFGRLPCPAPRNVGDSNANAYLEDCTGVVTGGVRENVGVVPARSLGIDPEYALDGWGNRLTYHVSKQVCPPRADGSAQDCTPAKYRDTAPTALGDITISRGGGTVTVNALYVIVSHGVNGNGAWTTSGNQRPAITAAGNEDENRNADAIYWIDPLGSALNAAGAIDAARGIFDDVVAFTEKYDADATPATAIINTLDVHALSPSRLAIPYDVSGGADRGVFCMDFTAQQSSVSLIMRNFDGGFRAAVNGDAALQNAFAPAPGLDAIIDVLWNVQELCVAYYPINYAAKDRGRYCPGTSDTASNREYSTDYRGCGCESPQTWDNAADKCVP